MKKTISISLIILTLVLVGVIIILFVNSDKPSRNAVKKYDDQLVERVGKFTASTSGSILNKKENICYSPISLYTTLCMAASLTEDNTCDEILKALSYSSVGQMEKEYAEIYARVVPSSDLTNFAVVANSLWIQESMLKEDTEEFVKERTRNMQTDIFLANYKKEEVNNWVSEKTNGNIKEVLKDTTKFSLINTTYFKGMWFEDFKASGKDDFNLASGEKIDADFMQNVRNRKYVSGKGYMAVQCDYTGNSKMVFVLPDENKDLDKLLKENILNEIIASFSNDDVNEIAEVTLKLPKFETNSEFDNKILRECLEEIGIKSMWDTEAWSDMVETEDIEYIDMFQSTYITVDEKGTEASATTSFSGAAWGIDEEEMPKMDITLDRPFMYIIMYDDIPLFIGTVYNPTEE